MTLLKYKILFKGEKNMKFDVITGNPMIVKQENGKYQVVYAQPPLWAIQNYTDLTLEEVTKLPFIDKTVLAYLK